jgi:NADPH:quinone reductase-like Zn-dependent oxidoreductase
MTRVSKVFGTVLLLLVMALSALALAVSHNSACAPAPTTDSAATMKAIVYRCYGAPEVLQYEDVAKPVAGDTEVLVKVHAAGVNPLDWHYMRGKPYLMRLLAGIGAPVDSTMGVDFAGVVEAVGKDVTRFQPGDEVFGGKSGSFAEYLTLGEDRSIALKPSNMSFKQAASVPIAAVSALQALRDKGQLQPGQKVLINGASGGVGTFAVQIAKAYGAEVTGVCSTRNVEMVRSIGADHVIDYTQEDYTHSGQLFDVIIDNVGNHSLLDNSRVMTAEGVLVMVGGPGGNWIAPLIPPLKAMLIGPFMDQKFVGILAEMNQQTLETLAELMQDGKMTPVIDRSYGLHETAAAIAYSEQGRARGKILVTVP